MLFLKDMDALDGDGDMLKDHTGTKATRDIVQFVPFSKYNLVSMLQQSNSLCSHEALPSFEVYTFHASTVNKIPLVG